ncbi:hypothetical protein NQZ79_g1996 [Umbelopsis isabellina]|nr:hypothetical protein NQZ79_g1996 [Umbelopsis isabellina]
MLARSLRILAFAVFAHYLVRVVGLLGIFRSVQPFGVETCQRIKGPTLCEDATHGTQGGEYYLTCDSTRNYLNRPMGIKLATPVGQEGEPQIWRMQLSKKDTTKVSKLKLPQNEDFHPLGIAMDKETTQLLVANTPSSKPSSIDFFSVHGDELRLEKRIQDPLVYAPNSIFILPQAHMRSEDGRVPSFLFSNDHYYVEGIMKQLENNLLLPLASVMLYDARHDTVTKIKGGFTFANGVTGNADASVIYVAETHGRRIVKFAATIPSERSETVVLKKVGQVDVPMAVDNLEYQHATGDVIAAGHPLGFDTVRYAGSSDKSNLAMPPSMVLRWKPDGSKEMIMTDNGSTWGTTTTAIIDPYTGKLIATGLYEPDMLVCDI